MDGEILAGHAAYMLRTRAKDLHEGRSAQWFIRRVEYIGPEARALARACEQLVISAEERSALIGRRVGKREHAGVVLAYCFAASIAETQCSPP